ncbi:MAG TPA: M48 family metallopeptidase, partial [Candidatus Angelobacter sp.]|nr:M48 family metallopeptidase [Candidatus Angelobacter sp.]
MRTIGLLLSAFLAVGAAAPALALQEDKKPAPEPAPAAASDDQTPAPAPDKQPAAPQSSGTSVKHPGGKDDVKAIGNRKVGGVDWYPIATDIKIGKTYSQQIEHTAKIIDDPVVNEYVNRLGQNLVRNSDAKFVFTFKIIDDDDINAISLPGGPVYINSGMILAADDEAELAGAMAHEIAHVALRHGTRQMTKAQILNLATAPLVVIGGLPGVIGPQLRNLALPATLLQFSRGFEIEADYFGTQYMYKAGYDPNALVTFFEKIEALEKKKPGMLSRAFATHPQTPDRIRKSQKEIATILPARDNYVETTSEFNDVKAHLAVLRNRRTVEPDGQDKDKPTLRKAADRTSSGDENKKQEDDRPVLQRRV